MDFHYICDLFPRRHPLFSRRTFEYAYEISSPLTKISSNIEKIYLIELGISQSRPQYRLLGLQDIPHHQQSPGLGNIS